MAGTVVVDAIKSSTTGAPTFQNTNGTEIGQLCRAWVNYNGIAQAVRASFNVSSVTRQGAGRYYMDFTTPMSDANYAAVVGFGGSGSADWGGGQDSAYTSTTSRLYFYSAYSTNAYSDCDRVFISVFR